jgi:D-glycero-D-manno-heptose 1,7-bisphosphate phosphatase
MLVGIPASGKSSVAKQYQNPGLTNNPILCNHANETPNRCSCFIDCYCKNNTCRTLPYVRLNRDSIGGKIKDLVPLMVDEINKGNNVLLDNTHCTLEHRKDFIAAAKQLGVPISCIWFNTSIENCEINFCIRMIERYGKILEPEELKKNKDPNMFPPAVLSGFVKSFCKPTIEEGFDLVEEKRFKRVWGDGFVNKGLLLDYDGSLRDCLPGSTNGKYPVNESEIMILPNRTEVLNKYKNDGYILGGISNQSGIHKGSVDYETVDRLFKHTNKLLGHDVDYMFCPHQSFPITCWCRKPNTANAIRLILKYKLDVSKTIFVGDYHTDEKMARKIGFQYYHVDEFFKKG